MKPNYNLKPYFVLAGILAVLMLVTAFAGMFFPCPRQKSSSTPALTAIHMQNRPGDNL